MVPKMRLSESTCQSTWRSTLSRVLIGAPPGYVGYDEGGQLTEAIRRRPYSVVLLDEIEKAHSDVFNILLQVLDDGRLTDNKGRTCSFKNTILIMTSNIAAEYIQKESESIGEFNREIVYEEIKRKVLDTLRRTLRPEFVNRIDEAIVFAALTRDEIKQIVRLQLARLEKLFAEREMTIECHRKGRVAYRGVGVRRHIRREADQTVYRPGIAPADREDDSCRAGQVGADSAD